MVLVYWSLYNSAVWGYSILVYTACGSSRLIVLLDYGIRDCALGRTYLLGAVSDSSWLGGGRGGGKRDGWMLACL